VRWGKGVKMVVRKAGVEAIVRFVVRRKELEW